MAYRATRCREIDDALRRIADEAGAAIEFVEPIGKGHRRVVYTYNGATRFDVLSGTPSSGGVLHVIMRQARRTLRSMGWKPAKPECASRRSKPEPPPALRAGGECASTARRKPAASTSPRAKQGHACAAGYSQIQTGLLKWLEVTRRNGPSVDTRIAEQAKSETYNDRN
jgi:hypothetical protein